MKKISRTLGLEFDAGSIKAALLTHSFLGEKYFDEIEKLETVSGTFVTEKEIVEGLKQVKDAIGHAMVDSVVSCISGKQMFASQLNFKMLPPDELPGALRLEMRKLLPFDTNTATIEYQQLTKPVTQNDSVPLLVAAISTDLLAKQVSSLSRVGFRPAIVDILPTAMANVLGYTCLHAGKKNQNLLGIHCAPGVFTLVFDGESVPFFSRSIYIDVNHGNTAVPENASAGSSQKMVDMLVDEISRSIVFYRKTYKVSSVDGVVILGNGIMGHSVKEQIAQGIGLMLQPSFDYSKLGYRETLHDDLYTIATVLAMREKKVL
jgi:Tfp pilus assembly PilM family ATPase